VQPAPDNPIVVIRLPFYGVWRGGRLMDVHHTGDVAPIGQVEAGGPAIQWDWQRGEWHGEPDPLAALDEWLALNAHRGQR
jgi:hypothetical protein